MNRLFLGAAGLLLVILMAGQATADDKKTCTGLDCENETQRRLYAEIVLARYGNNKTMEASKAKEYAKELSLETINDILTVYKQHDSDFVEEINKLIEDDANNKTFIEEMRLAYNAEQVRDNKEHKVDDAKQMKEYFVSHQVEHVHNTHWTRKEWEKVYAGLPHTLKYAHNGLHPDIKRFLNQHLKIEGAHYKDQMEEYAKALKAEAEHMRYQALIHAKTEVAKYFKSHGLLEEHKDHSEEKGPAQG